MVSQRDAVYQATVEVLQAKGMAFTPGKTDVKQTATADIRTATVEKVVAQVLRGEVSLKDTPANKTKLADTAKLKNYVSSLVSNHWSRDPQLNGGRKPEKTT